MEKIAQSLQQTFVNGVTRAVADMEKHASFQAWMRNPRFHEKFAEKVITIVTQVRGNPTAKKP